MHCSIQVCWQPVWLCIIQDSQISAHCVRFEHVARPRYGQNKADYTEYLSVGLSTVTVWAAEDTHAEVEK